MRKIVFFLGIVCMLTSCIGENPENCCSNLNVKNELLDTIYVSVSEKGISNANVKIAPDDLKTISHHSICYDHNAKSEIDEKNGFSYFVDEAYYKNRVINIISMSGDTLASIHPTSSFYDRNNWQVKKLENSDIDCTLILTDELIKSAKP